MGGTFVSPTPFCRGNILMEAKTIVTFIKAAELGSFSRTANVLGYSQAAVTVQIKQLEDELGTKLFDRMGKGIQLTSSGERFLPYAQQILKANEQARNFMQQDDEIRGTIRIGTTSSMANAYFPTLLREFSETYPHIKLMLKTSDYFDNLYEKLKQNEIDFALFIDRKMVYKDCNTVVDHPEDMIFIASPDNPLAGQKDIPIREVVKSGFITSDQEVSYPRFLDDYCKDNGIDYDPIMEVSSIIAISEIVASSNSVSFIPKSSIVRALEQGRVVALDVEKDFKCRMYSQIVYRREKWIEPHLGLFMEFVRNRIKRIYDEDVDE